MTVTQYVSTEGSFVWRPQYLTKHLPSVFGRKYDFSYNLQSKKGEYKEFGFINENYAIYRTANGWQKMSSFAHEMKLLDKYLIKRNQKVLLILGNLFTWK